MKRCSATLLVAFLALLTVSVAGFALRDRLRELWYVRQLRSSDDASRRQTAVEMLGEVGGDRSVDPLLEVLGGLDLTDPKPSELVRAAVQALTEVTPRANDGGAERVVDAFFVDFVQKTTARIDVLNEAMETLGARDPRVMEFVCKRFARDNPHVLDLAARGFVGAWHWDRARAKGEACLQSADFELVVEFLRREGGQPNGNVAQPLTGYEAGKPPRLGRAVAEFLRTDHPDERVRAVAVAFLAVASKDKIYHFDPTSVVSSYRNDESALVRGAALRMAGFLGNQPGTLDLAKVVTTERDPVLLRQAIEARTFWTRHTPRVALELWDGFRFDALPRVRQKNLALPWSDAEVDRLGEILASHREPRLRDAASFALADRYRDLPRNSKGAPEPVRLAGFEVHEWGVWLDAQGAAVSPEKIIAELPPFVHRSKTRAADLWKRRTYSPMIVTKPVVHFHVPRPLSLLVDVEFFEGRPWTYFPNRSRYTVPHFRVPFGPPLKSAAANRPALSRPVLSRPDPNLVLGPSATDLLGKQPEKPRDEPPPPVDKRSGFSPPWLPAPRTNSSRRLDSDPWSRSWTQWPGEGYEIVPWVIPRHLPSADMSGFGASVLGSVGLEWCGLRVGYAAELEPPAPMVEDGHWWQRLRRVPSATVARDGEADTLLFYDGSVNMPSSVIARWTSPERTVLALQVRDFTQYPDRPTKVGVYDRWWLRDKEKAGLRRLRPLPAVFVIHKVDGREAVGTVREGLASKSGVTNVKLDELSLEGEALVSALRDRLEGQGLTAAEADSLLQVWDAEFFRDSGTRLVTVLPQWIYDAHLPLRVYPVPAKTARVGLILTDCTELPTDGIVVDSESLEERWQPLTWNVPVEPVELRYQPLPGRFAPERLPRKETGEIELGGSSGGPALSADGSKLAFSHVEGTTHTIYLADLEARTLQSLWRSERKTGKNETSAVRISGDGRTVAFWDGAGYLLDLEARQYIVIEESVQDLSHDGARFLFQRRTKDADGKWTTAFCVVDRAARELRTLFVEENQTYGFVDLSDDGNRVGLVSHVSGDEELYVIDVTKGTLLNVSAAIGGEDRPKLSSDGSRVLFESDRDRDTEIYLADLNAKTLRNLTERDGDDRFPSLSADGRRAVYRHMGKGGHYVVHDLDGSPVQSIAGTNKVWNLWISANGRRAVYLRNRKRDGRRTFHIYVVDLPSRE